MTGGGSYRDGDGKLLIVQTVVVHIRDREVEAVSNWMTTGLRNAANTYSENQEKNGMNELRCQVK